LTHAEYSNRARIKVKLASIIMSDARAQLKPDERHTWQLKIQSANRYNILHHCRRCDREWVASVPERCCCGSADVESIACWQFPDD
jgi:hypothetical protein